MRMLLLAVLCLLLALACASPEAGEPTGPRLTGVPSLAVRTFAPAFRLLGGAARALDRPVRRTLEVLLWLEREARGKA